MRPEEEGEKIRKKGEKMKELKPDEKGKKRRK